MNRKQLVVLWIGGVLVAALFFAASKDILGPVTGISILTLLLVYTLKNKSDNGNTVKKVAISTLIVLSVLALIGLANKAVSNAESAYDECEKAADACEALKRQ